LPVEFWNEIVAAVLQNRNPSKAVLESNIVGKNTLNDELKYVEVEFGNVKERYESNNNRNEVVNNNIDNELRSDAEYEDSINYYITYEYDSCDNISQASINFCNIDHDEIQINIKQRMARSMAMELETNI
ncbi:hypothetical protein ROZALSC1DRAFT_25819, partial [Rozella allomycis CSF55]